MKRMVVVPLSALCACSFTVSSEQPNRPPAQHWGSMSGVSSHRHVAAPKPKTKESSAPKIAPVRQQIHEQYIPLYEKLTPTPTKE